MSYISTFVKNYSSSLDKLKKCADAYWKGVKEMYEKGYELQEAKRKFQHDVATMGNFNITPVGWRLLWGVGCGDISQLFLGAQYQSHGLVMAELHVPLKTQEHYFNTGIFVWHPATALVRLSIAKVTIQDLYQAIRCGGEQRTEKDQKLWYKDKRAKTPMKGFTKKRVENWILHKPYPLSAARLRELASIIEIETSMRKGK